MDKKDGLKCFCPLAKLKSELNCIYIYIQSSILINLSTFALYAGLKTKTYEFTNFFFY